MRVLLTGATGFLGKYVIDELREQGYIITAFGRNEEIGKTLEKENISFFKGDFTNIDDLYKASENVEMIVHTGALSTIWGKWEDFYNTNIVGTENVLKICREKDIKRLVYISSPSIYAAPKDQLNISENEAPFENNLNFYIKSKILAEKKIKEYSDVPTVILRPRGLFGIGDTSIIPRLLKLNNEKAIPLFDNGEQLIDITCVENVALAVRLALESDKAVNNIYNITNGEPKKFKEILDLFFYEMNIEGNYKNLNYFFTKIIVNILENFYKIFKFQKEPILTKYTLYLLKYSQTLSIEKAKQDLNYQPKLTIAEGIKKYVEHSRK
ncbi:MULTISPECIES: NAD-dependent epimerase/dehydratase family protein [Fusobacterium]|uniref:NAD-dependent epimerase/dehydratase family protein n=1 Tax=Fusobacterium TaxID=848 RepID=UPI0025C15644|nr:NAD(P)-dependent oxidoreductase [Fusobacterium sp.]MCI5724457.1 NAD(P)-dependent oxidoreductase [Fusobacterium sp.]MDY5304949.1 NAD(P)-dependent oxidoreductase [Fusobacterium gastrosuis]